MFKLFSRPRTLTHLTESNRLPFKTTSLSDKAETGTGFPNQDRFDSHRCVDSNFKSSIETGLEWYDDWLFLQMRKVPSELFASLLENGEKGSNEFSEHFVRIWRHVKSALIATKETSIDDIVVGLLDQGLVQPDVKHSHPDNGLRQLVFAIIGWQTMLYQSDYGSSMVDELNMIDDMHGFRGQSRLILKQAVTMCKRPLPDMLLNFGLLLPPPNIPASDDPDAIESFNNRTRVEASQMNAGVLLSMSSVELRWVDSISCHLEFDRAREILYIFRFPNFCLHNLWPESSRTDVVQSPLHACAKQGHDSKLCATKADVNDMLMEVLLSYRLLFGQSKQGRRAFSKIRLSERGPCKQQDPTLLELCTRKECMPALKERERETYLLQRDFPILRGKLAVIHDFSSERRPKTWKQLWRDKRDSGQWYTFWAVFIVGGVGVLLAFVQVVLQIIQIASPSKN